MTNTPLIRPYRGMPAEDRVTRRREALIDAALEVFDAEGWTGVSARRVCEQAGLTRRYFYESFEDVDALTGAMLERITREVWAAASDAVTDTDASMAELTRQAVSGGLDVLTAVPAKGRFLATSQNAGSSIATHRARAMDDLAVLVERVIATRRPDGESIDPHEARIVAITIVGAILRIVDSWLGNEVDLTRDEVVSWSGTTATAILDAATTRRR